MSLKAGCVSKKGRDSLRKSQEVKMGRFSEMRGQMSTKKKGIKIEREK